VTTDKNRKIDIREWFVEFEDQPGQADTEPPEQRNEEQTFSARLEAPTVPREVTPPAAPISGSAAPAPSKAANPWGKIGLVGIACLFVIGVIILVTSWGRQNLNEGGMNTYVYLLFVLAFIPYLYFSLNPQDLKTTVIIYTLAFAGAVLFHYRLTWFGTANTVSNDAKSIVDLSLLGPLFYLFYGVVILTLLVLGLYSLGKKKLILFNPPFLEIFRLIYPVLFIGGGLIILYFHGI